MTNSALAHTTTGKGHLIIVSGPSGVGKSTVLKGLFQQCKLPLVMSVSATTRPPRPGEIDGVSYYFLSEKEFLTRRENNEFLECVEVFGRGHWYGTLKDSVYTSLQQGKWVILEIDVIGAAKVLELESNTTSIFIHPGSESELEKRLRGRSTETEEAIQRRLEVARQELAEARRYQYVVYNQNVPQTIDEICRILEQEEKKCTKN